jgi:hypothetical protein
MTENNIMQKIKKWKPMFKRPTGRPKMRWEDDVLEDVRSMSERKWENIAHNRERWKMVIDRNRTL